MRVSDTMAANNQGAEELMYMQQLYEQQYRSLSEAITSNSNELGELSAVQKAIEESALLENRELFTHVGSGFYVRSKAMDAKTFTVGIGGGYLEEMSADYAKEYIARLIEKKSAELTAAISNRKKVESSLLEVIHRLDAAAGSR